MDDSFVVMLTKQLALQIEHMGGDPRDLLATNPDEWANFMRWNAFALEDEIHEAMNEVGWKPWATSRHLNREAFVKEMVDGLHFYMNLLLAASPGMTTIEIIDELLAMYLKKNSINAQRQVDGYDGVSSKCPWCKRELSDMFESLFVTPSASINCPPGTYCCQDHVEKAIADATERARTGG